MLAEASLAARRRARAAPRPGAPGLQPWVIPFDYGARFELSGTPGNVAEAVINISPDGVFVATAIGYGLEEDRGRSMRINDINGDFVPGDVTLGQIPADALLQGFRLSARAPLVLEQTAAGAQFGNGPVAVDFRDSLLQKIAGPREVSFLFSLVDSSTGRELQDEPLHNLASLGASSGERPFRPLARPLSFLPRSTVRLQVEERSEGTRGTLFIVLYGYRAITGTHCPEPLVRFLQQADVPAARGAAPAASSVIPFDHAAIVRLQGRRDNVVETEVAVNAEGGFVATALGYGLEPADDGVPLRWERVTAGTLRTALNGFAPRAFSVWDRAAMVDLADVPLRAFPIELLNDGIRIRPDHARLALGAGAALRAVPAAALTSLFESLNRPESVRFRYEISDSGTGRDLQNQALGNIAGLGIATGERPFKRFARPMLFLPRSTIRVRVTERCGRGNLFLVFQGYKILRLASRGVM